MQARPRPSTVVRRQAVDRAPHPPLHLPQPVRADARRGESAESADGLLRRAERLGFRIGRQSGAGVPERDTVAPALSPQVQRVFDFRGFPSESTKTQELQDVLENSSNRYLQFLKGDYGAVVVKLDPTSDENPGDASILYKPKQDGGWEYGDLATLRKKDRIYGLGAFVNVRKWFFDKYPIGKVLSMAAHEIGVHIVPYMDELMAKLPPEAKAPVTKKYIDETKVHGSRGKIDHLRVADVKHVDFELYRDLVRNMMGDIFFAGGSTGKAKAADLADAYLMDLATFTSKGGRSPVPLNAKGIAQKYNDYRKKGGFEHDVGPKKTTDVVADYATLYGRVFPVVVRHYPKSAVLITLMLLYFLYRWLLARLFT